MMLKNVISQILGILLDGLGASVAVGLLAKVHENFECMNYVVLAV